MKKFIFIIYVLSFSSIFGITEVAFAQFNFQLAVGGAGYDNANSIIQTSDSGYVMAGITNSFGAGSYDMYIVKFDGSGSLQWDKTVGGTSGDTANSIIQTSDGGYIVAGSTSSFGAGNSDIYIVKLNSAGILQWNKTIGGTTSDLAYCIIQTSDGGYALAGQMNGFCIVKLDTSGILQWSKSISTTGYATSIIQTTDGGYALAGKIYQSDFYAVKLDSSGTFLWCKRVSGNASDNALSIVQTSDGGFAVSGHTYSFGTHLFLVKLSAGGSFQWCKTIGGNNSDLGGSIIKTIDGGYALAGESNSFGGGTAFYLIKFDAEITLQWSKIVFASSSNLGYSIIQTNDGGYSLAGRTLAGGGHGFDFYFAKLDSNGITCGNNQTVTSIVTLQTPADTAYLSPPVYTLTPAVNTPASVINSNGTVTAFCTFTGTQSFLNELPHAFKLYQNYPNPFNPSTNIKFDLPVESYVDLKIYDLLGREIEILKNKYLKAGTHEVVWNASNYLSGVYFYKLVSGNYAETKRMVLIK